LSDPACIEIEHGRAIAEEKVVLGDCTADDGGWSFEESGLVRSQLDNDFCLQADYRLSSLGPGTPIRLMPCDSDEELQLFVFVKGQVIRPVEDDGLCVTWRGVNANIGNDPILLKKCDEISDELEWKLQ